jgi:phenylpropionate dioxygenase-like ring-hydroxylating dioxygenase large terminal subunit
MRDTAPRPGEFTVNVPNGLEHGLRNYWYPVCRTEDLGSAPLGLRCLGEDLVAWRDSQGRPHVFPDYCPHRTARLSVGRIVGDTLQCIFHGIRWDGRGECAFIPWEPESPASPDRLLATSYPVKEVRGLLFAYLGDTQQFPAPDIRDELPSELWDDAYDGYVMTETWNANWLLAVDGNDLYHVPFLHAQSATTIDVVDDVAGAFGADGRRMHVAKGSRGFPLITVVDAAGNQVFHGQQADPEFRDEGFYLPTLLCLGVQAEPGLRPHHVYLWMVPIDAERTQATRWVCRKATSADERAAWREYFQRVVYPRIASISAEDRRVAEAIPSLKFAREHEHLVHPDGDVHVRRLIYRDAFLAQQRGERYDPRRLQQPGTLTDNGGSDRGSPAPMPP